MYQQRSNDTAPARHEYGASDHRWLTFPWQEHLRTIKVADRSINYVDVANAANDHPPILFIHGLGGCWQNWLENIPFFADTRRVIALDLPGFSASEEPEETVTIPGYCSTIDRFLSALDIDCVELVGNSMGGLISADVAIEFPNRVNTLTLVSSAGMYATALGRLPRVPGRRPMRIFGSFIKQNRERIATRKRLRSLLMRGVMHNPNSLSTELMYEQLAGPGAPAFHDALRALLSHDLRAKLHKIECPTLVIWGRSDRIVPVGSAKRFAHYIPNAKVVILDKTGHVPQLERPGRFNQLLGDFLNEHT